jgi:hypothetical protein
MNMMVRLGSRRGAAEKLSGFLSEHILSVSDWDRNLARSPSGQKNVRFFLSDCILSVSDWDRNLDRFSGGPKNVRVLSDCILNVSNWDQNLARSPGGQNNVRFFVRFHLTCFLSEVDDSQQGFSSSEALKKFI